MQKQTTFLEKSLEEETLQAFNKAASWFRLQVRKKRMLSDWMSILQIALPNLQSSMKNTNILGFRARFFCNNTLSKFQPIWNKKLDEKNFRTYMFRILHQAAFFRLFLPNEVFGFTINLEDIHEEQITDILNFMNVLQSLHSKMHITSSIPNIPHPKPLLPKLLSTFTEVNDKPLPKFGYSALAAGHFTDLIFKLENIPQEKKKILLIGLLPIHQPFLKLITQLGWEVVGINYQRAYYLNLGGIPINALLTSSINLQHLSKIPGTRVAKPADFFSTACTLVLAFEKRPLVLEGALDRLRTRFLICAFEQPLPEKECNKLKKKNICIFPSIIFPSDKMWHFHLSNIEKFYGMVFTAKNYNSYIKNIVSGVGEKMWRMYKETNLDPLMIFYLLAWENLHIV